MKFFVQIATILIVFGFSSSNAQDPNVFCNFVVMDEFPYPYACQMVGLWIYDDENLPIVLGGNHLPGRGNNDVGYVEIMNSTIPFIITQFFTTFPNLEAFAIVNGGLTRVQSRAFSNAFNLRFLTIILNPGLRTIHANAFDGAASLEFVNLSDNEIDNLHDDTFAGALQIEVIIMENNAITHLPPNIFRFLRLTELSISNNQIESLDGRLLESSSGLSFVDFSANRISSIGRTFFDTVINQNLFFLDFRQNLCIDHHWLGIGSISIDDVRQEMEYCFSGEPPVPDDVRNFILELRGSLVLRYENGTEVIRLEG